MPAAAKQHTASGAEAFVRYYWDVANYAQAAGDPSALERISTDACRGCHGAIDFLRDVHARGGTIRGGQASLSDLRSERLTAAGQSFYRVTFKVSNTRQVVDEPGSKGDRVFEAATATDRFVLNWIDGAWKVGVWEVLG